MDSQTFLLSKSPLLTEEQIWHVTCPPRILQNQHRSLCMIKYSCNLTIALLNWRVICNSAKMSIYRAWGPIPRTDPPTPRPNMWAFDNLCQIQKCEVWINQMPPHGPNIVTNKSKVITFLFTWYSDTGGLFALQTNSMTTQFNHMSSFHISVCTQAITYHCNSQVIMTPQWIPSNTHLVNYTILSLANWHAERNNVSFLWTVHNCHPKPPQLKV